jgi:hypothetical protein
VVPGFAIASPGVAGVPATVRVEVVGVIPWAIVGVVGVVPFTPIAVE